jgi:hypothetical protein
VAEEEGDWASPHHCRLCVVYAALVA